MSFPNTEPRVPGDRAADGHVVGIDVGGSYVRAVLCDLGGREVSHATEPTPATDAPTVIATIARLAQAVAAHADVAFARVAGVGVGVPAVADPGDGTLRLAPNLPSFGDRDIVAALRQELGRPVAVANDVNVATLAEHRRGLAIDVADFAFIAVGTGVGMGLVTGGRLQHGATGAAGEIGTLPIGLDPTRPAGGHLVLEEIAGGAGLARRYAERTGTDVARAGGLDLYAAAASGDGDAAKLVDEQAVALALAVATVQSVLDPALVVFGGGLGSRADVVGRVRDHLGELTPHPVRLEASALGERAGLVGAAELAVELVSDGTGGMR
jgi:predicted NBD/HSP70 family sugar kinase